MHPKQQIDKCGKANGKRQSWLSQTQNLSRLMCLICLCGFICSPPAYMPLAKGERPDHMAFPRQPVKEKMESGI